MIGVLGLVALLVVQCTAPKEAHLPDDNVLTRNPAFAAYVSSYTGGMVPRRTAISIKLAHDVADSSLWNKEAATNLLKLEPAVPGKLMWRDARSLTYILDKPLPAGTTIDATLALDQLYDIKDAHLKNFTFQVETAHPSLSCTLEDVDLPAGKPWSFKGSVKSNDYQENELVEKAFTISHEGTLVPLRWFHSEDGRQHVFEGTNLPAKSDLTKLSMALDGEVLGVEGGDQTRQWEVPASGTFALWNTEALVKPEAMVRLHFTQALAVDQNLTNIVKLSAPYQAELPAVADGNVLTCFIDNLRPEEYGIIISFMLKAATGQELGQVFNTGNFRFPATNGKLQLITHGFVSPLQDGKAMVSFAAEGVQSVRMDVAAIAPEHVEVVMLNDMEKDYESGEAMLGNDPVQRFGKPVMSRLIQLNTSDVYDPAQAKLGIPAKPYQVDLTDLVKQYPQHLFKVWVKPVDAVTDQEETKPITLGTNRLSQGENDLYEEQSWAYSILKWWQRLTDEPSEVLSKSYSFGSVGYDYYYDEASAGLRPVSTMLLSSDLGLMAEADGQELVHFTVTNLSTTKPVSGAKVQVLSRQLRPLATLTTDGDGLATYAGADLPALAIAEEGENRTWLPLNGRYQRSSEIVGGISDYATSGLRGMVYSERGFYRPGDTVFATLLVEEPKALRERSKPVTMSLLDMGGRKLDMSIKATGLNGFYTFKLVVPVTEPSGAHVLRASVAGYAYTKSVLVGTRDANRMNISLKFKEEPIMLGKENVAQLNANYLFGSKAANLPVAVTAIATPQDFIPNNAQYKEYEFAPKDRAYGPMDEQAVFSGKLNEEGMLDQPVTVNLAKKLYQPVSLSLKTTVSELGGATSQDVRDAVAHPIDQYMGVRADAMRDGDQYKLSIAAVVLDAKTQKLLEPHDQWFAKLYLRQSQTWYEVDGQTGAEYQAQQSNQLVKTFTMTMTKEGATVEDALPLNDDVYNYELVITNPATGQTIATRVNHQYKFVPPATSQDAGELSLNAPEKPLNVGATFDLKIPSEVGQRYLVTVNNHVEVLERHWVEATSGDVTSFPLKAAANWTPNVFVRVVGLRPYKFYDQWAPIMKVGLVKLKVEDPATKLQPDLKLPASLAPMQPLAVTVSEATGKPMSYTLAVVDEGLLNLSRFKTPDPFAAFNQEVTMGVDLYSMYQDVMTGAGAVPIAKLIKPGGDEYMRADALLKSQRFKPVVRVLGPFALEKGDKVTHTIQIPNYFGQLRVMVVAAKMGEGTGGGAQGSAEAKIEVKADLMASLTGPEVAGPGEQITLPLTLFQTNGGLKEATITLMAKGALQPLKQTTIPIKLNGRAEQVLQLSVTTSATGPGLAVIEASVMAGGKLQSVATLRLPVRQANLPLSFTQDLTIGPGKTASTAFQAPGPGSVLNMLVSSQVLIDWEGIVQRADQFPNGSALDAAGNALAQLTLIKYGKVKDERRLERMRNNAVLTQGYLQRNRTKDGLYCRWRNEVYADPYTSLAALVMQSAAAGAGSIEARNLEEDINLLAERLEKNSLPEGAAAAQVLLALLAYQTDTYNAKNKILEQKPLSTLAAQLMAMLPQEEPKPFRPVIGSLYGGMPSLLGKAIELKFLTHTNQLGNATPLARELSRLVNEDNYLDPYQEAVILDALCAWQRKQGSPQPMALEAKLGGANWKGTGMSQALTWRQVFSGKQQLAVTNHGAKQVQAQVRVSGIPAAGTEKPITDGIALFSTWRHAEGQPIAEDPGKAVILEAGEPHVLEVVVRNTREVASALEIKGSLLLPTGMDLGDLVPPAGVQLTRKQDMVVFSTTLAGGKEAMFTLRMTPRTLGTVRLPSVIARAYQERYYQAVTAATQLKIVEPNPLHQ